MKEMKEMKGMKGMKGFRKIVLYFSCLFLFLFFCCKPIPKQRYKEYFWSVGNIIFNDTLQIQITNDNEYPVRLMIDSNYIMLQPHLTFKYEVPDTIKNENLPRFRALLGDPNEPIKSIKFASPIHKNKKAFILQGNHGKYSHTGLLSKYAIDFKMQKGDTVYAAAEGIVYGLIEDYKHGGSNKKWLGYDNFITLYHPNANLFSVYSHLTHQGVLVERGQKVKKGDPIGIIGKTGYTDITHLHFFVKKPTLEHYEGVPFTFSNGKKSTYYKRGMYFGQTK